MRYRFADCILDTEKIEFHRTGELVHLEPLMFATLNYLVQNCPRLISRGDLLAAIWKCSVSSDETVDKCISKLRDKIGDVPPGRFIRTLRKSKSHRETRWRFVADVIEETVSAEATGMDLTAATLRSTPSSRPRPDAMASLEPHQISRPDEPEFQQFLEIMEREFDPEVRDSEDDLVRYLRDTEHYKRENPPCHDTFLVSKFKGDERVEGVVTGILYASNYPTLDLLFISYIALDHKLLCHLEKQGNLSLSSMIRTQAMQGLLRELSRTTHWSKGIIIEIEKNEKNDARKRLFRGCAQRNFGLRLYQIDLEYDQPPLDPRDPKPPQPQDLLFIPGDEYQSKIVNNELPREDILDLLRFVYDRVYGGNFDTTPDGEAYKSSVEAVFQRLRSKLPDHVALTPL